MKKSKRTARLPPRKTALPKTALPKERAVDPARVRIRQLTTGVPGLDDILGGGVPEFSLNVLAGAPGSGSAPAGPVAPAVLSRTTRGREDDGRRARPVQRVVGSQAGRADSNDPISAS